MPRSNLWLSPVGYRKWKCFRFPSERKERGLTVHRSHLPVMLLNSIKLKDSLFFFPYEHHSLIPFSLASPVRNLIVRIMAYLTNKNRKITITIILVSRRYKNTIHSLDLTFETENQCSKIYIPLAQKLNKVIPHVKFKMRRLKKWTIDLFFYI